MAQVFSYATNKGGVGKTTSVINCASALVQAGKNVLLVDLDNQMNLSTYFGQEIETNVIKYFRDIRDKKEYDLEIDEIGENLSIICGSTELNGLDAEFSSYIEANFLLDTLLQDFKEHFDYILIDCPPSIGLATKNALIASDKLFIPVQAKYVGLDGYSSIVSLVDSISNRLNPNLEIGGVFITHYGNNNLSRAVESKLSESLEAKLFETRIRLNTDVATAAIHQQSVLDYKKSSIGARDYRSLANEMFDIDL